MSLAIGVKFDLYVIHIFDSKSRRNGSGQSGVLILVVLVWRPLRCTCDVSVRLCGQSFSVSDGRASCVLLDSSCGVMRCSGGEYRAPRHHIGDPGSSSFFGSGSHRYCTIRFLHRSMSVEFMLVSLGFDCLGAAAVGQLFICQSMRGRS